MNNKIITAILVTVFTTTTTISSVANTQPATVAIIDTALNANLPVFKDRIVHEVCIIDWNSCRNKNNFMEGPGAASMNLNHMARNGFNHGTKMASASVLTNPNIKIVFIRIVGATASGDRQITNESTFVNALNWVLNNRSRFNITAVAMSQGHSNYAPGVNYCPSTPKTEDLISSLDALEIPVFLPSGNLRDLNKILWPACISKSIAVSAISTNDGPAIYTNYDKNLTDMFAIGRLRVSDVNGFLFNESGSSVSTQVAAAVYVGLKNKYPAYTKQQILDLIKQKSYPVKSKTISAYVVHKDILND